MKEEEIRPADIFDEYLKLAVEDTREYFQSEERLDIDCPACGREGEHSFSKQGFDYAECAWCRTLFVSPRPPLEAFSRYYRESKSVEFWATTFYRATEKARREKLWKPKAKLIRNIISEHGSSSHHLIDIGGGYGVLAEEYRVISGADVLVIEPGPSLAAICRERGLSVISKFLEEIELQDLPDFPKAFVSFELFEHLYSPRDFLNHLKYLMGSDDLFIFSTLSGTGLDIQVLWEKSKSVAPPHHLNFLNPRSVRMLIENVGLSLLQVTTPGKLDVDILHNNRSDIKDRFWRTFIDQSDPSEREAMQEFISSSGLSSHMLVVCKKV